MDEHVGYNYNTHALTSTEIGWITAMYATLMFLYTPVSTIYRLAVNIKSTVQIHG